MLLLILEDKSSLKIGYLLVRAPEDMGMLAAMKRK
jgi:hypothetical protein